MDPLREEYETRRFFVTRINDAYFMHPFATAFGYELFGEDHLDKTLVNLDSAEMLAALDFIGGAFSDALDLTAATLDANYQNMFEEQRAVYMINGPWALSSVKEAATNGGFEFGVTKLPTVGGTQPVTFSGVQIAAVYKGTNNPTAAFKFVEFMTSDEGLAIMYDNTNKLPALKDVSGIEGVSTDAYLSGVSQQLAFSHPMPIIPEMGFFWSNAGSMYQQVFNGTKTPADASAEAQTGFEEQAELTGE